MLKGALQERRSKCKEQREDSRCAQTTIQLQPRPITRPQNQGSSNSHLKAEKQRQICRISSIVTQLHLKWGDLLLRMEEVVSFLISLKISNTRTKHPASSFYTQVGSKSKGSTSLAKKPNLRSTWKSLRRSIILCLREILMKNISRACLKINKSRGMINSKAPKSNITKE